MPNRTSVSLEGEIKMAAQICENCEHKHDRCYCAPNSTCDKYEPIKMVNRKSWDEFRNNGLLWWINMILHTLGWAIVTEIDEGKIIDIYPARVKFRGFGEKNNTEGYIKVSQFMKDNAKELLSEAEN